MPETSTPSTSLATLGPEALRIVLFGMPDAGKSSLLGALAGAAETQEHLLHGHLTDLGGGLTELRHRLYDEKPRETLEEVVPYAVRFDSFAAAPGSATEPTEAVLVDCDGRVANELLTRRRALAEDGKEGSLAQAILDADALLLVVDASATPSQVDADFREFGRFLRLLEQNRGRRSDVGGLPVFLVLAKCDLLAQPTDTPAGWIERIEERKRQVAARFQAFVLRQGSRATFASSGSSDARGEEESLPFGRIDLHLWASAVKRPPLAGASAQSREPYGVAELFRQAFALARAFEQRRSRAGRRLAWTVAGGAGAVVTMATLVAALLVNHPHTEPAVQELATKIESYHAREAQTPSSRLREPLQPKISELTELQSDPHFSRLPPETQEYVQSHLQELLAYRSYLDKLRALPPLSRLHSEADLEEITNRLSQLDLPAEHQTDWKQTDAALVHAQLVADVKALRQAITEMDDWYRGLLQRGQELWTFTGHTPGVPVSWPDWHRDVQNLLREADALPHRPADRLTRSGLTYATVFSFDRVAAARDRWEMLRRQLERVRDLSAALGLTGALPGRASLDLPAGFQAEQAEARLQELEKAYPRFRQAFTLTDLPEAIVGEIRQAARTRYENAIKAGQEVVLRHLLAVNAGSAEEKTGARPVSDPWQPLLSWLAAPDDLKAWRVLATVLARLQNPAAEDPVSALAAFLRRDAFELNLSRLTLDIPDEAKVRPDGKLVIHHLSGSEKKPSLLFEPTGEEVHDARRRLTRFVFRPQGDGNLRYLPGDTLWADLPVLHASAPGWMLTWARSRSQRYQFERLSRPPRLHAKNQENTEGEVQEGILLEGTPEGGIPKVPDLLPVVPVARDRR